MTHFVHNTLFQSVASHEMDKFRFEQILSDPRLLLNQPRRRQPVDYMNGRTRVVLNNVLFNPDYFVFGSLFCLTDLGTRGSQIKIINRESLIKLFYSVFSPLFMFLALKLSYLWFLVTFNLLFAYFARSVSVTNHSYCS